MSDEKLSVLLDRTWGDALPEQYIEAVRGLEDELASLRGAGTGDKRFQAAVAAMQGLMATRQGGVAWMLAADAVKLADALLAELAKEK